jgi:hypothetical protein
MLQNGHPNTAQAAAMRDLIDAADLTKTPIGNSVKHAVGQRARIDQAVSTKDPSDIARALNGYARMKDLERGASNLDFENIPNDAWSAGVRKFLQDDTYSISSLLKDDKDWALALKPRFAKSLGQDPFPKVFEAAISAKDRTWFYYHCLQQPGCAENLATAIERDGTKLLKTPADLRQWAENLTKFEWHLDDDPGVRKRLYAATYRFAQTPETLLAIGDLYEHQDKMGQFFKTAEKMGLEKFSNGQLIQLGRETSGSQQRRFFEAALNKAQTAEDVSNISYEADYSRALEKKMRERLIALGVKAEDWRNVSIGSEWDIGHPPSATESVPAKDCLGLMDRIRSAFRWRP